MHSLIISIGSNTPDRWEQVNKALIWLGEFTISAKKSKIYHSKPEGNCAKKINYTYANAVYCALTALSQDEVESMLKKYEADNGRTPQMKLFGIVPIDLDLVFFDDRLLRPQEMMRDYFKRGYEEIFPETNS